MSKVHVRYEDEDMDWQEPMSIGLMVYLLSPYTRTCASRPTSLEWRGSTDRSIGTGVDGVSDRANGSRVDRHLLEPLLRARPKGPFQIVQVRLPRLGGCAQCPADAPPTQGRCLLILALRGPCDSLHNFLCTPALAPRFAVCVRSIVLVMWTCGTGCASRRTAWKA